MSLKDLPLFFSGSSCLPFAQKVASLLKASLGQISIEKFPDGEIGVQLLENVRGRDIFVVQTIARDPNSYLMELLIIADALKRASSRSITAVIPYYGYARQDRKEKGRVPITAKLVADLLQVAGVSRVLTMDLHTEQIQGFFNIPVDHLSARALLVEAVKKESPQNSIVVTPDVGSVRLARFFADALGVSFAVMDKRRLTGAEVAVSTMIGDVSGRDVILVDDMFTTGNTLRAAAAACKAANARKVIGVVTHGVFAEGSNNLGALDLLFCTDTISPLSSDKIPSSCRIVSVARLFADAIDASISGKSVSCLLS